jgi:hypothetical protein
MNKNILIFIIAIIAYAQSAYAQFLIEYPDNLNEFFENINEFYVFDEGLPSQVPINSKIKKIQKSSDNTSMSSVLTDYNSKGCNWIELLNILEWDEYYENYYSEEGKLQSSLILNNHRDTIKFQVFQYLQDTIVVNTKMPGIITYENGKITYEDGKYRRYWQHKYIYNDNKQLTKKITDGKIVNLYNWENGKLKKIQIFERNKNPYLIKFKYKFKSNKIIFIKEIHRKYSIIYKFDAMGRMLEKQITGGCNVLYEHHPENIGDLVSVEERCGFDFSLTNYIYNEKGKVKEIIYSRNQFVDIEQYYYNENDLLEAIGYSSYELGKCRGLDFSYFEYEYW